MPLPLAIFEFNSARFEQLVVNLLAVCGAFMAGWVLTGLVVWAVDKWVFGYKFRLGFYKAMKYVGGTAAAVLALFILFGHGSGWTLFGGGGDGDQNGTSDVQGDGGQGTSPTRPTDDQTPPEVRAPILTPEAGGRFERIRVTVLAGADVQEGRFYQVEEDRMPKTIGELESDLKARKQAARKPIGVVPIYPAGSGADTNGASLLFGLARREGFPIIPLDTPK